MPSSVQVYSDTQANILALTAANIAAGSLLLATDTLKLYFCNGTAIQGIGAVLATAISNTSAGLKVTGNLNPSFTPVKNSDLLILGNVNISTYGSGTLGIAVTYNQCTSGTKAAQTDQLFLMPTSTKTTTVSTAGNAAGVWKLVPTVIRASGGKSVQLKTTGTISTSAWTVDYQVIQLTGP